MRGIKKTAVFVFKIGVTAFLVYWVVRSVGFDKIRGCFAVGSFRYLFYIAVLISVLFSFLKVYKWHIMLQQTSRGGRFGDSSRSYLAGMAGGLFTPGRIGEISRFAFLKDHKKNLVIGLVMIDRLFDLAVVLFLALFGLFHFASIYVFAAAAGLIGVFFFAFFYPRRFLQWVVVLTKRFPYFSRFHSMFLSWVEKIAAVSLSFKVRFLFYTIISYVVVMMEFYFLVSNYRDVSIEAVILVQPVIMLVNILPITIAGLGVREGTAVLLLASFGIPAPAALSSAFWLFLLNTALPGIAGMVLLLFYRSIFSPVKR